MKKVFVFFVVLCLFVPLLSVGASSSSMAPLQQTVAVGNTVCVQATIYSDLPVYAMEVKLKYDTSKLTPVITDEVSAKSNYVYSIQGDGGGTVKGFNFYFKATAAGTCSFTLYDVYFVDSSLTKHSITGVSCTASVCTAGDVNGDGAVNILDLMQLKRYMAGASIGEKYIAADYNDSKSIEAADLISLKKAIIGQ